MCLVYIVIVEKINIGLFEDVICEDFGREEVFFRRNCCLVFVSSVWRIVGF